MAEANSDFLSSLRALIQSELIDVNTSIQGVIVSYTDGFATVRPVGNKRYADGDLIPFPEIRRVPVRWPVFAGGNAGVRGPIQEGDKCMIVFAQQAADGTDDIRRFDISDAYAILVDNAQQSGGSNNADMVMYFGSASLRLTPSGQLIITAPGGTQIETPSTTNTGTLTTQGLLTYQAGMTGSGGSGAAIVGDVTITGNVTNNGKNIGSTHTHGGVATGGGTTGQVS